MDAEVASSQEYLDEKAPLLHAARRLLENIPRNHTTDSFSDSTATANTPANTPVSLPKLELPRARPINWTQNEEALSLCGY